MSQAQFTPMGAAQRNNFDLVRLFAAVQVVVVHLFTVMPGLPGREQWLVTLSVFPGVPIFFFISGYLISGSWQRNPRLAGFIASRALRIFPGLWLAVSFSMVLLMLFYREPMLRNIDTAVGWFIMQATFLQVWHPEFLRGYGFGVINPALWTIPIEMGFYVATPLLFAMGWKLKRVRGVLLTAALVSFVVFTAAHLLDRKSPQTATLFKVLTVSPVSMVSWLWMFLLGALAHLEFARLRPWVENRFPLWGGLALGVGLLSFVIDLPPLLHLPGNEIGLLNALATSAACLSFAYSYPGLAARWLRGHDLSYGIYLFHMPLVNTLMFLGIVGVPGALVALVLTGTCAAFSWHWVERPALAQKKRFEAYLSSRPWAGSPTKEA